MIATTMFWCFVLGLALFSLNDFILYKTKREDRYDAQTIAAYFIAIVTFLFTLFVGEWVDYLSILVWIGFGLTYSQKTQMPTFFKKDAKNIAIYGTITLFLIVVYTILVLF